MAGSTWSVQEKYTVLFSWNVSQNLRLAKYIFPLCFSLTLHDRHNIL